MLGKLAAAASLRPSGTTQVAVAVAGIAGAFAIATAFLNVALPPIQQDLGFSPTGLSWVVNAYTLAFGALAEAHCGEYDGFERGR